MGTAELCGRGAEFRIKSMRNWAEGTRDQMPIGVCQSSRVLLQQGIERFAKFEVVQIRCQRALPIVVVDLSPVEFSVPDSEIEDAGAAVVVAAVLKDWDIRSSTIVDKNVGNRPVDADAVQIPLSLQERHYANPYINTIDLQERRLCIWGSSFDREAIELEAQVREIQGKILQVNRNAQIVAGVLLDNSQ